MVPRLMKYLSECYLSPFKICERNEEKKAFICNTRITTRGIAFDSVIFSFSSFYSPGFFLIGVSWFLSLMKTSLSKQIST